MIQKLTKRHRIRVRPSRVKQVGCTILLCAVFLSVALPLSRAQTTATELDLFIAGAALNRIDVLAVYLKRGVNPNGVGRDGKTALIAAIGRGHLAAVKFLLARKADVNAPGAKAWSPVMEAAYRDRSEIVRLLLKHGADPNARGGREELTPIILAARGNVPETVSVLARAGADVNARGARRGRTALIYAFASMKKNAVQIGAELLAHNANINGAADDGWTPLLGAVEMGDLKRVRFALANGADLYAAARDNRNALVVSAEHGHHAITDYLLKKTGSKLITGAAGGAALAGAIAARNPALARRLLDLGVDVNGFGKGGKTPLILAASTGQLALTEILLSKGALPNKTNRQDGTTALMWAANVGDLAMVRRLLAAGAEVGLVAADNWTAVQAAIDAGHDNIADVLRQAR